MVEDFESDLVAAFNNYFSRQGDDTRGYSYRLKQAKFTSQIIDVLIDSRDVGYHAIEAKSVKQSSTGKLYFSQHFSESDGKHQVENITSFLKKTGRIGFLAVEKRRGRGKPREGFLIPWEKVDDMYGDDPGISLNGFEDIGKRLERGSGGYIVDSEVVSWMEEHNPL